MFASQDWHGVDAWLYNWNCVIAGVVTNRGSDELVSRRAAPTERLSSLIVSKKAWKNCCPSYMPQLKSPNELRRLASACVIMGHSVAPVLSRLFSLGHFRTGAPPRTKLASPQANRCSICNVD
jgi:hypothetical protein